MKAIVTLEYAEERMHSGLVMWMAAGLVLGGGGVAVANPSVTGCSDGSREGFTDTSLYRIIAACGGAWTVPGAFHSAPACARAAGNGGANSAGDGCNVEDLCAAGWHVCYGPDDIDIRTGGRGCQDAVSASYPNAGSGAASVSTSPGAAFFMTRTSGSGVGNCDEVVNGFPQSFNDIFGCGNLGAPPQPNCAPLNRFGHNQCQAMHTYNASGSLPASVYGYLSNEYAWFCNDGGNGTRESQHVTKSRPGDQGGVLCCKDSDPSLPEVCDGLDNNANGTIDETDFDGDGQADDVPGSPCTTVSGQDGTLACSGNGGWTCVPVPAQACCLPDGACLDLAPTACGGRAGEAQGRGSSCASVDGSCPRPTVACCRADGSCDDLERDACLGSGGAPGRSGSSCELARCEPIADGAVKGRLWHDVDADGLEDSDEPGLAGVKVALVGATETREATTGTSGAYGFDGLLAGTWRVVVDHTADPVLAAGEYRPTTPRVGGNGDLWSVTSPVTLVVAQSAVVSGVDFGFITGCVGADADDDGICDEDDGCFDLDGDGYGEGPDCRGSDCDETIVTCNVDCETDMNGGDGNGVPDCEEATCLDNDGDGYGEGEGCAGSDCDDDAPLCVTPSDCGDADGDRVANCLDDDDDNDGVPDRTEDLLGSDPTREDSDGDGLSDGDEVNVHFTSPTEADTDGDGASDAAEVEAGTSPTDAADVPEGTTPPAPEPGDGDTTGGTGGADAGGSSGGAGGTGGQAADGGCQGSGVPGSPGAALALLGGLWVWVRGRRRRLAD